MSLTTSLKDDALFSEYKRLRQAMPRLTSALLRGVSKPALKEGAKKLGLLKGNTFVFGSLQESDVLMDYCIYSCRRGGQTAIERFARNSPPPEGSDHAILLNAMLRSHYSIFQVKEIEKGRGITMNDLLRNRELLLFDVGLSSTAVPYAAFAGRVLPLGEHYMTSGAFIPLNPEVFRQAVIPTMEIFLSKINREAESPLLPPDEARFSAQIIRAALREGLLDRMTYADIESQ